MGRYGERKERRTGNEGEGTRRKNGKNEKEVNIKKDTGGGEQKGEMV